MDRRKSLKALALGSLSAGVLLNACKTDDKKIVEKADAGATPKFKYDRMPEETEAYNAIVSKTFFNAHEMATITILGDIIIPKDAVSGSASEAKVPDFIEFIVKDIGYAGNKPNQWNGVPDDVLKQYNIAYTEKELKECVSFDKA